MVRSGQSNGIVGKILLGCTTSTSQQWLVIVLLWNALRKRFFARPFGAAVVIEALEDQDTVGEAEINGEKGDCWYKSRPYRSREVCDIANSPDSEEQERNALRRLLSIVFH